MCSLMNRVLKKWNKQFWKKSVLLNYDTVQGILYYLINIENIRLLSFIFVEIVASLFIIKYKTELKAQIVQTTSYFKIKGYAVEISKKITEFDPELLVAIIYNTKIVISILFALKYLYFPCSTHESKH